MSFDQRFQITGRIAGASGQTDHALSAREISTGRSVTIHLLAGGHSAPNEALLAEIGTLPPEYQVCFLETGDQNGTPYVVTDAIAGNPPLRQWMTGLKSKIAADKAMNPKDATVVRAWNIPRGGQAPAEPQTSILEHARPGAAAPPRPAPVSPGGPDADEFSRLLAKLDPPKTPASPPAPTPSSPASGEAGEFTRLLRAQSPAPPPPAPAAPPAAEPGEFTRLLRAQAAPPPSPAAPPPPAPAAPPAVEAGEFTRRVRRQLR